MKLVSKWNLALMLFAAAACSGTPNRPGDPPDIAGDGDAAVLPAGTIVEAVAPETLLLAAPSREPLPELPAGVRVRALSLNLYGLQFASAEVVGAVLGGLDLDLIALQECPAGGAEAIAAAADFPHHAQFGGQGLLAKTALDATQGINLKAGRSLLLAQTDFEGVTFSVASVHIGWHTDGNKQARELIDEVLPTISQPHLLWLGDYNDEVGSTQNLILGEALVDAQTLAGMVPGTRVSWPSTTFEDTEGAQIIDLAFARKSLAPIVIEADILNTTPLLSDHKPSLVALLYPADGTPFAVDPMASRYDLWRGVPASGERPANLLENPGAESGTSGWVLEGGDAISARAAMVPRTGAAFFAGEAIGDRRVSGGAQTVALEALAEASDSGRLQVLAGGLMRAGYATLSDDEGAVVSNRLTPQDSGELIVELLDAAGTVVARQSTGPRDTYAWTPAGMVVDAPPGTCSARLRWLAHRNDRNGSAVDIGFDDLYLSARALDAPHGVIGAERAGFAIDPMMTPDAEGLELTELEGWSGEGWRLIQEGEFFGFVLFPPRGTTGAALLAAGDPLGSGATPGDSAMISRMVDLSDLASAVDAGGLVIEVGAQLRTYKGIGRASLRLEAIDADGSVWGQWKLAETSTPEWGPYSGRVRIPKGARTLRVVITASNLNAGGLIFADALRVRALRSP